ncbi:TPA_asm: DUF4386 family protein [Listeria monocytogenes]|nr:DUF4386 domain-containing protein [Listeria monocytogenes]EAE8610829.1 DUF4386 domain-containing protein [Listeria monocytogenes]EAF5298297.1 DUF4386 domain-containing protein [Listeria monocytogenes]EAF7849400.1 DUF4386 domain-containing protein [Listeria monocytogenes]HAB7538572.1 DUF4386 family protein [Listeria monocytogenes]
MLVFETEKISQRRAAIIAGITMLVMVVCATFAVGFVSNSLIVKGDASATVSNIFNSLALFRGGLFCWLVILVSDIIVSWALYIFLKQVDNSVALLGAWFRLIYCAILGTSILNLVYVLLILSGGSTPATQSDQLNAQVMLFIDAFNKMWSFGLIIFGLHLLIIGTLILKSGFIPKFLGILLLIAALSYVIVHLLHVFFPQFEQTTGFLENILSLPMALGELAFGIWLLIRGGRTSKPAAK